jgi:nucleoid-associated protein YgaU
VRDSSVAGMPHDPPGSGNTFATESPPGGPASHYRNDQTTSAPAGDAPTNYAGAPMDNARSNYSPGLAGYAPDNSPRHADEVPGRMRAENPLRGDGMYEVQPNDSYWTISERVYGSGAYFRALAEQNRGKAARPDRLPPGLVISTPPVAQLEKDYPDLCPRPNRREAVRNRAAGAASLAATTGGGRVYVVQEGDTLSSIARNELGKVSRWAEIYQLNREALGKDYDYLTPGLRLVLPARDLQSGDRTTRRSDSGVPLLR